ncbi:alpha/beta fold hydrolase [Pseudahrensia aquimaris]|uniref:Alpha/beta fold hydrolase n=1 Tax=Pseudahrensia aquimaris TaxID=744461 RepID=A0ABW3FJH7_9HYPH
MSWKSHTLPRSDDAQVQIYSLAPASPRAIVHINHGMAEHADRYEQFAEALSAAGYAAIAHDHRGHGNSFAPDTPQGHYGPGGFATVIEEVQVVQAHARETWPGLKLISFGHSMGSIIAFNNALRHPTTIDGLALWNSGVETGALGAVFKAILKTERFFKGSDVPSQMAQKLTFQAWNKAFVPNRTDFDWLSRDEIEVDKYIADPLCGFPVTIGLWLELLDAIYFAADNQNLANLPNTLPVHLLAGDQDPCSLKGEAVRNIETRMSRAGLNDVTFTLLKDTRHESLNELNRDETTADFIAWLDKRFA